MYPVRMPATPPSLSMRCATESTCYAKNRSPPPRRNIGICRTPRGRTVRSFWKPCVRRTIRRVELEYCQYSSRYDRFKAGEILNAFTPSLGNAAIMDIGVYAVHVCGLLFGMPDLTADFYSRSVFAENHMELMGEMLLPYRNSAPVRITYAKIYNSLNPSVILGENGGILIDKLSNPKSVRLKLRDGTDKELCTCPTDNNMTYELAAFARCIRTGENPHTRFSEIEMAILDRIREKNGIVFQ